MLFTSSVRQKIRGSNWRNGTTAIQRIHRGADRFRQQRAEDHVVFPIEQDNVNSVGRKLAAERFGAFNSAKASAND